MEVKGQRSARGPPWGGPGVSAEQKCERMNKNRIRGIRRRASSQLTANPIFIKDAGCKFGGYARIRLSVHEPNCAACQSLHRTEAVAHGRSPATAKNFGVGVQNSQRIQA